MKIAVLVRTRIWGGLEVHAVGLINALQAAGHDVVLAAVGDETAALFARHIAPNPPAIVTIPDSTSGCLTWYRRFKQLKSDACIFEKGTLHTGDLALELGARLAFRAFVAVEHLDPPQLSRTASRRYFFGLVPGVGLWRTRARLSGWVRSVAPHRTICVAGSMREELAETYHFNRRKLVVIHNGVDSSKYRPRPELRRAARETLGFPQEAFVFGTMRRLIPEKGVDVAIRAFAQLVSQYRAIPLRYVIGGVGSEQQSLESLVRSLGLSEIVRFVGFVDQPAPFYAALDAFIVPSRIEAQGIVVLEAMASGCEVIASAVGGIPEMIDRPGIGRLVAADDVVALASAMTETLNQQESDRHSRSTSAREHVIQHFSADHQYRKVITLVEHLLSA